MKILKAKLLELERRKEHETSVDAITGEPARGRLRQPDPLLRAAALPAGEGPALRAASWATPTRCSTATSTTLMEAYLRWMRAEGDRRLTPARLRRGSVRAAWQDVGRRTPALGGTIVTES